MRALFFAKAVAAGVPRFALLGLAALLAASLAPLGTGQYTAPPAFTIDGDAELDAAHGVVAGSGTAQDPFVLVPPSSAQRLEVRNTRAHLRIDGGEFGSREQYSFLGDGVVLDNVANVTVSGVHVVGFQRGVHVIGGRDVRIEGSIFASQVFYGVRVESGTAITVSGSVFNFTQAAGVSVRDADGLRIDNNTFDKTGRAGGRVASSIHVGASRGVTVVDNAIAGGEASGLLFEQVEGYLIEGNEASGTGLYGFWMDHSQGGVARGNRVTGNAASGIYICHGLDQQALNNTLADNGVGLDLSDDTGIVLQGNVFEGNHQYGLNIVDASFTLATGNRFVGHQVAPKSVIRVQGDDNTLANNTGEGNSAPFIRNTGGERNTSDGVLLPVEAEPEPPATHTGGSGGSRLTTWLVVAGAGAIILVGLAFLRRRLD